ncbi:MAG: M20/M25/M40 family metallo-hydrolase [Gemmatimonadota bacterium]
MIDWEAAGREVTGYLQALIRIDTTNPPGNETAAARYLAGILEREGIAPAVTESAPRRGNVTGRLRGGSAAPLLLLGHTDVVGVEAARWTHPPFGGELVDGYVWGRGALDMKCMVAAELMVLLLLKRQGATLRRDVLFAATADEEAGEGGHGIGWLLDHHPEQVEAPVVLTEGGGSDLCVNGQRYYTCQVGQKGTCRLRVRASGSPGHGSMPHDDNAVVRLCRALAGLDGARLPTHVSAGLRGYVEGIAAHQPEAVAVLLRRALEPGHSDDALEQLPLPSSFKDQLRALMRNTASLTMLVAGSKINVIPAEAVAHVDGRLAPGQTQETFLAELRSQLGDDVEIEVLLYRQGLEATADTDFFRTVQAVMARHDPEAPVLPSMSTGGTDAKHICPRRPAAQVYGFMPHHQRAGEEEMRLIHGHDERIAVENLVFGTRVLYDLVLEYCAA